MPRVQTCNELACAYRNGVLATVAITNMDGGIMVTASPITPREPQWHEMVGQIAAESVQTSGLNDIRDARFGPFADPTTGRYQNPETMTPISITFWL